MPHKRVVMNAINIAQCRMHVLDTATLLVPVPGGVKFFYAALTDMRSLWSTVWSPVLANLRSITYCNDKEELDHLPPMFRDAYNCEYVAIAAATLGTAQESLLVGRAASWPLASCTSS